MLTDLEAVKFADGKYRFFLPLKQIVEIERNCGQKDGAGLLHPKSIYIIHEELGAGLGLNGDEPVYIGGGAARASDIREVVRCALIGGNQGYVAGEQIPVGPQVAAELCDGYLYPERPLVEGQYIAWAVLDAAIRGVALKKKAGDQPGSQGDLTADGSSPTADSSGSTGKGPASASTRKRSKPTTKA